MSEKQVKLAGEDEVPCMLLPVMSGNLLVPTVSVAEMSPVKPLQDIADKPQWLMGFYSWRDMKVPVIAYEVINGQLDDLPLNKMGRIAVLNNTGVSDKLPFIGIHTQGIPRMSRVGPDDIKEKDEADKNTYDMMVVRVGLESFVIPDISALEQAYLDLNLFT